MCGSPLCVLEPDDARFESELSAVSQRSGSHKSKHSRPPWRSSVARTPTPTTATANLSSPPSTRRRASRRDARATSRAGSGTSDGSGFRWRGCTTRGCFGRTSRRIRPTRPTWGSPRASGTTTPLTTTAAGGARTRANGRGGIRWWPNTRSCRCRGQDRRVGGGGVGGDVPARGRAGGGDAVEQVEHHGAAAVGVAAAANPAARSHAVA